MTDLIEDDEVIQPDENLIFYGLDSIRVMKLSGELKTLGVAISFEELAKEPTIAAWWSLIETRRNAA